MPEHSPMPDLPLDDEDESHIDHGQIQVEPGDPAAEQYELACGDCSDHDDPEAGL